MAFVGGGGGAALEDVEGFVGAAGVGFEEDGGGKEVRVADAPGFGNVVDDGVVEGEERAPEERVLFAEFGGC